MLKPLYIESTPITPLVELDKGKGVFKMKGKSIPSNPYEFYKPIFDWWKEYLKEPNKETIFEVDISYFNSTSALHIAQILDYLRQLIEDDYRVLIKWFYEEGDVDIQESGEEMAELFNIPIELVPVKF